MTVEGDDGVGVVESGSGCVGWRGRMIVGGGRGCLCRIRIYFKLKLTGTAVSIFNSIFILVCVYGVCERVLCVCVRVCVTECACCVVYVCVLVWSISRVLLEQ